MIPSLSPSDLSLPAKFLSWRPGQLLALNRALSSPCRFIAHSMPVGEGKSLYAIAHALLSSPSDHEKSSARACILTATKGLQKQYLDDFHSCGLVDIRGRNNYPCSLREARNCEEGQHYRRCSPAECTYEKFRNEAMASSLVVTNYRYFMLSYMYGRGLGNFDLLVCDEAHDVHDEVCDAMAVEIAYWEATKIGVRLPPEEALMDAWIEWAKEASIRSSGRLAELKSMAEEEKQSEGHISRDTAKELHFWTSVDGKIKAIAAAEGTGEWVQSRTREGRRLEPVWAYNHAQKALFREIPKIVFTSATMVKKTLHLLGVKDEEVEFCEYQSSFPVKRSPVYLFGGTYPTQLRIDNKTPQDQLEIWMSRIDNIIGARLDRKGIIHTVSYERARYIRSLSEYSALMIVPESGKETSAALESFRRSSPPSILVSPSITTGYDFPFQACEYNIIAKVPFLDSRTPIMMARQKEDAEYSPYITAQTITQAHGRSMRDATDQSETFIADAHIYWFIKKHKDLFPFWFHRLVTKPSGLPQPPRALMPIGNTNLVTSNSDSPISASGFRQVWSGTDKINK